MPTHSLKISDHIIVNIVFFVIIQTEASATNPISIESLEAS